MARDCVFDERGRLDPANPFVSEELYEAEKSSQNQEYIFVRSEESEPNYDSVDRLSDQDVLGWLDENGGAHVEEVAPEPDSHEIHQHEDVEFGNLI